MKQRYIHSPRESNNFVQACHTVPEDELINLPSSLCFIFKFWRICLNELCAFELLHPSRAPGIKQTPSKCLLSEYTSRTSILTIYKERVAKLSQGPTVISPASFQAEIKQFPWREQNSSPNKNNLYRQMGRGAGPGGYHFLFTSSHSWPVIAL